MVDVSSNGKAVVVVVIIFCDVDGVGFFFIFQDRPHKKIDSNDEEMKLLATERF